MYSLAPAWMAATAARASFVIPQATIGTWMCSASSRITRSRMSMPTSTSSRSAPLPPRSTAIAWALLSAWVTAAPLSIAIFVAAVSWPLRVPTIRRRMMSVPYVLFGPRSRALGLDDFCHGDAELVVDEHDFASRNEAVVDVDIDGFADFAVELDDGARPECQQAPDVHLRAAEN